MNHAVSTPLMIGPDQVREALTWEALVEPISEAFKASSAGLAQNGLIVLFPQADRTAGDVYVKAGVLEGRPLHIVKVAPWFVKNTAEGRAQGGFTAAFDSETGLTLAVIEDQHRLSDLRTAAAGALAARALAPKQIRFAGVLGSGIQAYWQTLALYSERPFKVLHIWARDPDKAQTLAKRLKAQLPGHIEICITDRETAVRTSDVLITATGARDPIVLGSWLRPGQHVTAVGADDATKCELDAQALNRARVFVDEMSTAIATGDVHRAISLGNYTSDQLAGEIGQVLDGSNPGRTSPRDITIATFSGIAAQDLAAVETLLRLVKR